MSRKHDNTLLAEAYAIIINSPAPEPVEVTGIPQQDILACSAKEFLEKIRECAECLINHDSSELGSAVETIEGIFIAINQCREQLIPSDGDCCIEDNPFTDQGMDTVSDTDGDHSSVDQSTLRYFSSTQPGGHC